MQKKDVQMMQQIDVSQRAGIFFVSVSAILVGVCVGLLGANTVFHSSMKDLGVVLVDSADELLTRGTSTMGLIEQTNLTMITTTHNIMSIYNIAKSALEEVVHKRKLFDDLEEVRYACIASSCAIIIVGCMIVIHTLLQGRNSRSSTFSWSATYGKQAMVGVIGCGFLQCLMWSGSGLHASISILSADLCDASNNLEQSLIMPISVAADADPGILAEYVDYFAFCNHSAPFADALVAAHNLVTNLENKINASIENHVSPEIIEVLENNTKKLAAVLQSLDQLFACDYISEIYYSTKQLICVNTLNSGFVAAAILAVVGLLTLIVVLYICRLICAHTSRPQYTLVSDT